MRARLLSSFSLITATSLHSGYAFSITSYPQVGRRSTHHSHRHLPLYSIQNSSSPPSDDDALSPLVSMPSRRAVVASAASALLIINPSFSISASALEEDATTTFVRGTATLQSGLSIDESVGPNAALYVTARPNRPDNVPKAILDGSRGKPPPVLSARFATPTFPFDFTLTSQNLTPEGASVVEGASGDGVWWAGEDLIVSARLDSDGVAATRDPTDLVGRGIYSAKASSAVSVELQGRGIFGKSVTAKK